MSGQCPWKIRWAPGQDARCDKPAEHLRIAFKADVPSPLLGAGPDFDPEHHALLSNGVIATNLTWMAGDRREYTGEYPGPCPKLLFGRCTLHLGHQGSCAP